MQRDGDRISDRSQTPLIRAPPAPTFSHKGRSGLFLILPQTFQRLRRLIVMARFQVRAQGG